ncbi:DegV family protein [Furfurilactobacillus rossiae]|uniref:DegV family protein n=1 Tax=Furfurilactobacillus rossiae TaxID=231049 RepID=UPI0015BDB363|nr:DegV family protein [Furfurilactobacillus rossiae]QLE65043.1 DegV family protein [Furfurilactobacillus rossiae]
MKTAVITDSASYLDPEVAKAAGIRVVPITVIFGTQTYLENVDITSEQFYKRMREEKAMPSTAQVTMMQMQEQFDELIKEGYDEVICIHLSSGITTFLQNLEAYAPTVKGIKVYPFDSRMASEGEACLALLAAKMAKAGKNAAEILPVLEHLRETTHVYFVVDDLSHLLRTGRITNSSAFVGNLLRIKPILTFEDAKIVALTKERTAKRAFQKVKRDFEASLGDEDYPVRVGVIDGNNPDASATWMSDLTSENLKTDGGKDPQFEVAHIGPSIGVHTGEKVMGLVWAEDWQTLGEE